jgi:hypothetical protein
MGFAISLEYIPCMFALHSMSRAFFVAKVFHSDCPQIILAEVESVKFVYNLYLPDWIRRCGSIKPELSVGNNSFKDKKFSGSKDCEKKLMFIKKNVANNALKKAKKNLQILKAINDNQ